MPEMMRPELNETPLPVARTRVGNSSGRNSGSHPKYTVATTAATPVHTNVRMSCFAGGVLYQTTGAGDLPAASAVGRVSADRAVADRQVFTCSNCSSVVTHIAAGEREPGDHDVTCRRIIAVIDIEDS